jgi:hypothetical protein
MAPGVSRLTVAASLPRVRAVAVCGLTLRIPDDVVVIRLHGYLLLVHTFNVRAMRPSRVGVRHLHVCASRPSPRPAPDVLTSLASSCMSDESATRRCRASLSPLVAGRGATKRVAPLPSEGRGMPGTCTWLIRRRDDCRDCVRTSGAWLGEGSCVTHHTLV